jgi:hypothetical protein
MKSSKFILALLGSTVISFAAFSQQDSTKPVQQEEKKPVTEQAKPTEQAQPIVTTAETNLPKPNAGRHFIPVIGSYQASGDSTAVKNISITVDEQNPGKIWIEGLEPVKIYALLKAIPGTYKIPAQKVDDKKVAEGTLVYDDSNKQINLCVGCGYSDASPSVAAAEPISTDKKSKVKKAPVVSFTGSKTEMGTASK